MKRYITFIVAVFVVCQSCSNQSAKQKDTTHGSPDSVAKDIETGSELLYGLENYIRNIEADFSQIPNKRKEKLKNLASFIQTKISSGLPSHLIFICTHNSRRSHMCQIWAQAAAFHYGITDVHCYSGGTEATAFNPRTVRALRKAGFNIEKTDSTLNPVYQVYYSEGVEPVKGFSKKYDDPSNPQDDFAAIMTCSEADDACPLVRGASVRIAIPYDDPKIADNTPNEEAKYDERCRQIATEMFYTLSLIHSK